MTAAAELETAASAEEQAWPRRGYAWYVVLMLMLAYAFSLLDRTGISLLVRPIEADLHISDGRMGLLQGGAFAIFYGVLGLPIGFLTDRVNRRSLVAAGISVWSAATMMCGVATGYWGLFAARVGVGAGEASLSPAGISMIADYFPPVARGKAFGVFAIGTSLGVGMSLLLGGVAIEFAGHLREIGPTWLAALAPWKIVFFLIGAPGLLVGAIFAVTVREPDRRNRAGIARTLSLKPLFSFLSSQRAVLGGLVGWTVLNSVSIYALLGWFPQVMIRSHGWTAAETGQILGAYSLPCSVFSCLSGGWTVSWLQKRGRPDAPIFVAIGASLWVAVAGIVAALAPTANGAVVFYCILSLATNNGGIGILTAINQITPNELRGQVIALFSMATGLVSVTVGPFAVGYLSDNVFTAPNGIGPSVATVLAVATAMGIVILFATKRSFSVAVTEASRRLS